MGFTISNIVNKIKHHTALFHCFACAKLQPTIEVYENKIKRPLCLCSCVIKVCFFFPNQNCSFRFSYTRSSLIFFFQTDGTESAAFRDYLVLKKNENYCRFFTHDEPEGKLHFSDSRITLFNGINAKNICCCMLRHSNTAAKFPSDTAEFLMISCFALEGHETKHISLTQKPTEQLFERCSDS